MPHFFSFLKETDFCVQRLTTFFQNIPLHFLLFKTILLVIFGIIDEFQILTDIE